MMLRRLKEDVEKSLAPKEETIVEVSHMTVIFMALEVVLQWKLRIIKDTLVPILFFVERLALYSGFSEFRRRPL